MNLAGKMTICVAFFALLPGETTAAEIPQSLEDARIEFFLDEDAQYVRAKLRCSSALDGVRFRFGDEPWQPTIGAADMGLTYTMAHGRVPFQGRRVAAVAQDPASDQWILITGTINEQREFEEQSRKVVDQLAATSVPAGIVKNDAQGTGGYQLEFLTLVNEYRARRGLGPLSYDDNLEAIAERNNRAGGYHRYTGGTAQIWAMGFSTVSPTLIQWQNSPGHNSVLLGAGYSHVGIHFDGRNWTANFS